MLKGGRTDYEGDAHCLACGKVSKYHASFSGCPYCGHTVMEPADLNSESGAVSEPGDEAAPSEAPAAKAPEAPARRRTSKKGTPKGADEPPPENQESEPE